GPCRTRTCDVAIRSPHRCGRAGSAECRVTRYHGAAWRYDGSRFSPLFVERLAAALPPVLSLLLLPPLATSLSASGASTLIPPRSSRIHFSLLQARSCLLTLSRVVPSMWLSSRWVIASLPSFDFSSCARRSSVRARRVGSVRNTTSSKWMLAQRNRAHNSSI